MSASIVRASPRRPCFASSRARLDAARSSHHLASCARATSSAVNADAKPRNVAGILKFGSANASENGGSSELFPVGDAGERNFDAAPGDALSEEAKNAMDDHVNNALDCIGRFDADDPESHRHLVEAREHLGRALEARTGKHVGAHAVAHFAR
jgi:hypothetical protein